MELPTGGTCRQSPFLVRKRETKLYDPKQVDIDAQRLVVEIRLALERTKRTSHYTWKLSVLKHFFVSLASTIKLLALLLLNP